MSTEKQLLHSPHRRIYLLLCVSRTRTKFADAVRRIGNVASGKWKEKQQQTELRGKQQLDNFGIEIEIGIGAL